MLLAQKYNVSIKAREDSVYICWQYENLSKLLRSTPSLAGALDAVVGYDVYKKLLRAQELHIADSSLTDRVSAVDVVREGAGMPSPKSRSKVARSRINMMLSTLQYAKKSKRSLLAPGSVPADFPFSAEDVRATISTDREQETSAEVNDDTRAGSETSVRTRHRCVSIAISKLLPLAWRYFPQQAIFYGIFLCRSGESYFGSRKEERTSSKIQTRLFSW